MGMWGWGFLIGPAVSGLLAEPVRQYPGAAWLQTSWFLEKFPFFLPNAFGALLCFLSMIAVRLFVVETLPEHKVRDFKKMASDTFESARIVMTNLKKMLSTVQEEEEEEARPILDESKRMYGARNDGDHEDEEAVIENLAAVLNLVEEDIDASIREAQNNYGETVSMLSTASPRQSITQAISRRSSVSSRNKRARRLSESSTSTALPPTFSSLMVQKNTRNLLILYWVASFVMVAIDEGFPLFCLSKAGGLGLSESTIGSVMSASGLIFVMAQYLVFAHLVEWFGLYGSIRIGCLVTGPIVSLMPISIVLNKGKTDDHLTVAAFLFLSGLTALYRVFGFSFFSSVSVALNRSVLPSQRGTMNGISTVGGSITKAFGPAFTGALVAFSFSSGVFPPRLGAVFMFVVIGGIGSVLSVLSFVLLDEAEAEDIKE
jgi:MFS family permease